MLLDVFTKNLNQEKINSLAQFLLFLQDYITWRYYGFVSNNKLSPVLYLLCLDMIIYNIQYWHFIDDNELVGSIPSQIGNIAGLLELNVRKYLNLTIDVWELQDT